MPTLELTTNQQRVFRIALMTGVAVLLAGLVIPAAIRALIEAGVLAAAFLATVSTIREHRFLRLARIGFLLLIAIYVALLLHPNLPSLKVGMEGIRYTLVAVAGLLLGIAMPDRPGQIRLIPAITTLLLAGVAVSLAVHLIFPGLEDSLDRSADVATGQLGGQIRMQGLLSGPFHISMAGAFLTLSGIWLLLRQDFRGVPLLVVGESVLLLARVRTGLLVTALGIVLLIVLLLRQQRVDPGLSKVTRGRWLVTALAVPVLAVVVGLAAGFAENGSTTTSGGNNRGGNSGILELQSVATGHRTASRVTAMKSAVRSVEDSPAVGWGPGAAASGLSHDFAAAGKRYEGPHNGPLGVMVETGIVGFLCFLLTVVPTLARLVRELLSGRQPAASGIALAAALPLGCFFLVGDALGALPVSLCLALITGVYLAGAARLEPREATDGP